MTFKRFLSVVLVFACLAILSSCTTYYISVESFKAQFAMVDTTKRSVITEGPLGGRKKYAANSLDFIQAVDKKGNAVQIPNGPSIEIRITDTLGKKNIFYFDQVEFDGETITGRPSRIISSIRKSVPIGSVKTIEVQNGRKNYHYVH